MISDEKTPESTYVDPLEATIADIYGSQELMSQALHSIDNKLEGLIRSIGDKLGEMQALEAQEATERQDIHKDVKHCLKELRDITRRLNPLESKVAGIELFLSRDRNDNGSG